MRMRAMIAAVVVSCAQAQAQVKAPEFDNARYAEDYSYLRDPRNRTGAWWEPFKFIALNPSGTRYLTFGADARARYQHYVNRNWGSPPEPTEGYGLLRAMPYADLHLNSNIRLFGQLIGAWAVDLKPAPSLVDESGIDLLQGFGQVQFDVRAATLMLQGGRQLMRYGAERLIGLRWGANVPRAFDGGRARFEGGPWRTDAFFMHPVANGLEDFDDAADPARRVWSLYATRDLPNIAPHSGLDLFYIGFTDADARYEQGSGFENRQTFGARYFGNSKDWNWDLEGHLQIGSFGTGDILAWSLTSEAQHIFSDLPLKPFIGFHANAMSGDLNPEDTELNSYNALFPRGKYFGKIGLIGPRNLLTLHPGAGVDLGNGWSLRGEAVFFWRESLGDGIYGEAGNLIRASDDSLARYIGAQGEVVLRWSPVRGVDIEAVYSVFDPGRFIEETGPAKTVRFIELEMQLRF